MEKVEITIIGAGVIGLACAAELSKTFDEVIVMEKYPSFGQETSSRNSEVIHAGIYYPPGSLKAKLCLEGKKLLYDYCREHAIHHKMIGKLVVATNTNEARQLEKLFHNGSKNGVNDLRLLSRKEIQKMEPHINASSALYSPSTGIFDTHAFMKSLESEAKSRGVIVAYATECIGLITSKDGFTITVKDEKEGDFRFCTHILINASGLHADKIAKSAGIDRHDYTLKYCKGDYFRVHHNKGRYISHLIYPTPAQDSVSLGIHTALDLAGGLRLGPDAEYVDRIDYAIDDSKKESFYQRCHFFLPFIDVEDLSADTSGIRAKLQGPGENFRDFIIKEESDQGIPGLVNLVGIDSPGLTSALSIAKQVKNSIQLLV